MGFELHPDLKRDGTLVGRFPLCLALLINDQSYPWFVLVPERENIRETIDLTEPDYEALWKESRAFGAAIRKIFGGEKLNMAALGNVTPQLHVHHIVRYSHDPAWPAPIWGKQPMQPRSAEAIQQVHDRLNQASPCVKVVFPMPAGNATVILKPMVQVDGSMILSSDGSGFGDVGFYRVQKLAGKMRVWRVGSLKEHFHLYQANPRLSAVTIASAFWA